MSGNSITCFLVFTIFFLTLGLGGKSPLAEEACSTTDPAKNDGPIAELAKDVSSVNNSQGQLLATLNIIGGEGNVTLTAIPDPAKPGSISEIRIEGKTKLGKAKAEINSVISLDPKTNQFKSVNIKKPKTDKAAAVDPAKKTEEEEKDPFRVEPIGNFNFTDGGTLKLTYPEKMTTGKENSIDITLRHVPNDKTKWELAYNTPQPGKKETTLQHIDEVSIFPRQDPIAGPIGVIWIFFFQNDSSGNKKGVAWYPGSDTPPENFFPQTISDPKAEKPKYYDGLKDMEKYFK